MQNLTEQHPWLKLHSSEIADYIPPEYYNRILKEYAFGSLTDLEIFRSFLMEVARHNSQPRALELGPGSGRVTDVFLDEMPEFTSLDLVDLSLDMLNYGRGKFKDKRNLSFQHSDSIDFLAKCQSTYDLVFSLWSFSHSVHQHLIRDPQNKDYVAESVRKFIEQNIAAKGKFFMIHFDSQSEEQEILFRQWKKAFPIFSDTSSQSPSKQILDEVFADAQADGLGVATITHLEGNPIRYSSIEEALEVFMNFHMETYFNVAENVAEVLGELTQDFTRYATDEGIFIKPGCFIYTFERK